VAIPITALHHITNQPDTNSGALIEVMSVDVAWPQIQRLNFTMFEKLGTPVGPSLEIRNNMIWKHGIDIAWGERVDDKTREVTSEQRTFQKVRDDFEYQLGQCVGIAVFSEVGATALSAQAPAGTDDDFIRTIYGAADRVNIYAGRITFVGVKHIEYDFNTFGGCSGAVVFLTDKGHPVGSSARREDIGHAIAVHAGSCSWDANFWIQDPPGREESWLVIG
jgi:hypothetical protein